MPPQQELSMAVNIPPNAPPHVYAAAAEKSLEWGRPDGALQICELGLSRHPGYTGLRVFRAEALLEHNRVELAEKDLRAALAAEPQHPRAIKMLAHVLLTQRRFREAIPILERAEFIRIGDPDITEWLAAAEQGAKTERAPEPDGEPAFVFTEAASERIGDLAGMPGVRAVSLLDGADERRGGPDAHAYTAAMLRLRALEEEMEGVLQAAGFGRLTDVAIHEPSTFFCARRGARASIRVVADSRVREGLIAWQCKKVIGEEAA